jgi:hypothetical protein
MAVLFVLMLLGGTIYAPFVRQVSTPLRLLIDEIRTSFYRKLFLLFVLAAVGPVLIFAVAFGLYMTAKFQADVESEAASTVTVARRVLEQTAAAGPQPSAFSDDVMVWVGQVVHQEVNLFEGSELLATSQRDLYAGGYRIRSRGSRAPRARSRRAGSMSGSSPTRLTSSAASSPISTGWRQRSASSAGSSPAPISSRRGRRWRVRWPTRSRTR